jgi:hypothetical protein
MQVYACFSGWACGTIPQRYIYILKHSFLEENVEKRPTHSPGVFEDLSLLHGRETRTMTFFLERGQARVLSELKYHLGVKVILLL